MNSFDKCFRNVVCFTGLKAGQGRQPARLPSNRQAAIRLCESLDTPRWISQACNEQLSPLQRKAAVMELGRSPRPGKAVLRVLRDLLQDPYYEVREAAILACGNMGREAKSLAKPLCAILNKEFEYPAIYKQCIKSLNLMDPDFPGRIDPLIRLVGTSTDRSVREAAYKALNRDGTTRLSPQQQRRLKKALNTHPAETDSSDLLGRLNASRTISCGKFPQAMKNYRNTFFYMLSKSNQQRKPSLAHLVELHKRIMGHITPRQIETPEFKKINWGGLIRGSIPEITYDITSEKYLPAVCIPSLIKKYFQWFDKNYPAKDALMFVARAYKKLMKIHPFYDANGRTVRLFMDWVLKSKGYWIPAYSENYLFAMFRSDAEIKQELQKIAHRILPTFDSAAAKQRA